ncbi:MAG: hypothetical protein J6A01_11915 [Proteobacteria bacterium]|nr:hypothetical protein [Pseudomonadota bacterium]
MAEQTLKQSEQIERVRKAVIAAGGSVTVGDIVSKTGLGQYEAKEALDALITTHEGTMRVSQNGDLLYAFSAGVGLRDGRSWWDRNKKAIYRGFKKVFKIVIMLVLVIYFIIYLLLILALLSSNRNSNSRSSFNLGGVWYFFWGYNAGSRSTYGRSPYGRVTVTSNDEPKKSPLYTRVYNFVFGPEEEEVDPLKASQMCAQLIRAKNGVITAEDWMLISGQSFEKSESDLARFTAEFEGTAEITDNGTLVYVFEDMMKSNKNTTGRSSQEALPDRAWNTLEGPRPLSGNINGGNGGVIALNTFNLIMSGFFAFGGVQAMMAPKDPNVVLDPQLEQSLHTTTFWLGIFPFVFSFLIFAIPLMRLPGNRKENRERRVRAVHNAALSALFDDQTNAQKRVGFNDFRTAANRMLAKSHLDPVQPDELKNAITTICDELGGEPDANSMDQVYVFDNMEVRLGDAKSERQKRKLNQQDLGRVIYSSDSREQENIDDNDRDEFDEFDRALQESAGGYSSNYSPNYSSGSQSSNASRNASHL